MLTEKDTSRQRGLSNLVVTLILIAAAVVGGGFLFTSLHEQMGTTTRNVSLRVRSLNAVSTTTGAAVSTTVKNNGTVVLENVEVKVLLSPPENDIILQVGHLAPGQTGSDHESGDRSLLAGKTYPVLVTAGSPRSENAIARTMSVLVRG